ncbi:DivIVA domain-containing protein [Wukongibacter sp. M2B1]|uniref:DivIVA domain-containing protein n=1 Tax=Wukongibacter sp. M2B1 TaxID=3088895 RepID=UPI003D78E246
MITPLDIQNKEFTKAIRGYKEIEVDDFLDKVIDSYEKIYNENMEYKEKIRLLEEQLEKYNSLERTLKDTLVVAQSTAEEVAINANKKAELIINEAESKARKIIEDANNEVLSVRKEYEEAKKDFQIFKTRFKTLLESQLELVESSFMESQI